MTTIRDIDIEKTWILESTLNSARYFFKHKTNRKFIVNDHHRQICDVLDRVISGELKRVIINVAPRYSKCVHPETIVMTSRGLKTASDISVSDLLYSYDEGKAVLEPCLGIEKARKRSVKIKMRSGREITCSYDHPMLTTFGYEEVQNIKVGDRIKALRADIESDYEICDDELIFTTLMILEGGCSGKNIRFSSIDKEVLDILYNSANNLGIGIKQYESNAACDFNILGGQSGIANTILKKYEISGHKCYTKRIPKDWFSLSLRQKLLILELMFMTDGYIHKTTGQGGVCLANKELVFDLQQIASSCNIISSITYKPNNHAGGWAMQIPRGEMQKLYARIDFHQKQKAADLVFSKEAICITDNFPYEIIRKEKLTYKTNKPPFRCVSTKNITRPKFERLAKEFECLEKYIDEDFYLDEVIEKTELGEIDLIHLEVNRTKNFIANGLVSHNTELVVKNFITHGFALNPECKFIHLSYSDDLARDNSSEINESVSSPEFRRLFEARVANTSSKKWNTTQGGGVYAVSSGGQVTGFGAGAVPDEDNIKDVDDFMPAHDSQFNGAIIIDDPIKPDDALSDLTRNKVNNKFETTIRNRVNSRDTPIIIIMQRLHENDLCGYLTELEPDEWFVLSLPCIYEDESGEEKALWEFKHTLEELKKIENANSFVFETQYMQNPTPQEGLMYESFKTYEPGSIPFFQRNIRKNYTDTADEGSDYLCSINYTETPHGCYVTDVLYTKKAMEYTEPKTAEMLVKGDVEMVKVESNNGGRGFARAVEKAVREYRSMRMKVEWFHQSLNKNVRIFTHSAEVQNMIYFPSDWAKRWPEFYKSMITYRKEGKNKHDDAQDTVTGIVENIGKGKISRVPAGSII